MNRNDTLTEKQCNAIIELLNPDNGTITSVADKLNVGRKTLYRWLEQPEFRSALEAERNKLRDEAFSKLKTTLVKAVDTLKELLDSPKENIRLRASQAILDTNFKIAEYQELEERIKRIEEALSNDKKH